MNSEVKEQSEEVVSAAIKLGVMAVKGIAEKTLKEKRNIQLKDFMKMLDDYLAAHDSKVASLRIKKKHNQ